MKNHNHASGVLNILSDGYSPKVTAFAENPNRWIALYMIPGKKKIFHNCCQFKREISEQERNKLAFLSKFRTSHQVSYKPEQQ